MRPPVSTPRMRHLVPGRGASASLYSTYFSMHACCSTAPASLSALCFATRLPASMPNTLRKITSPMRLLALNTECGIPTRLMSAFLLFVPPFASLMFPANGKKRKHFLSSQFSRLFLSSPLIASLGLRDVTVVACHSTPRDDRP